MAIQWGAWEYSGGNGMRVGIEIEGWTEGDGSGDITHTSGQAQTWVSYYTENQYSYSDSQTLTLSGAIDGTVNFTNNDGGAAIRRERRLFEYDYGANEYGSSPGSRTFTVKLSGAFNGVTPSKSVTVNIPARPIAAPNEPTNVSVTRISDGSHKITWTNKDTAGEPWDEVQIDRETNNSGSWSRRTNAGGGSTSYTDSTYSDMEFQWRVRAKNSAGTSSWVLTDTMWTTPDAPTNAVRQTAANGLDQVITWTNNASTNDYDVQVWRANADTGVWTLIATLPEYTTSYTDVAPDPATPWKYRVRAKTSIADPVLYSAYSNETTATAGQTSPPNAPTNLEPSDVTIVPTSSQNFTWTHNSTDGTGQSAYEVRYRATGDQTWITTGQVIATASLWVAPANTFANDATYEWQVRTWGTDPTVSAWSGSVVFSTALDPSAIRENKRAVLLNTDTGDLETAERGILPPVGSMLMYGGANAPAGWLLCQGQEVLQNDYPELFAVIGTTFNTGTETAGYFRLPDLRHRYPVGAWDGTSATVFHLGESDGSDDLLVRSDQHSHSHSHPISTDGAHSHGGQTDTPTGGVTRGSGTADTAGPSHKHNISSDGGHNHGGATSNAVGIRGDNGSAHAYQAVNFIIKT